MLQVMFQKVAQLTKTCIVYSVTIKRVNIITYALCVTKLSSEPYTTVLKYENMKSAFTFTHYTSLKLTAYFSSSIIVVCCCLVSELSYQLHIS